MSESEGQEQLAVFPARVEGLGEEGSQPPAAAVVRAGAVLDE